MKTKDKKTFFICFSDGNGETLGIGKRTNEKECQLHYIKGLGFDTEKEAIEAAEEIGFIDYFIEKY